MGSYVVQPGDNWITVAQALGVSESSLLAANAGRGPSAMRVGETIQTPSVSTPTPTSSGASPATQNAADALSSLFGTYGLGTLSGTIVKLAQQGLGADSIALQLQQTPEYQQRFAANAIRIKNGMNALTPAEYIATENAYRQIMSNAGMPVGFYDQQSDFTDFIAKDISPTELQGRVSAAAEAINQAPAGTLDFARQWYGTGDLVAYALDPNKAAPLIERNLKAAEAAALAQQNRTSVSQDLAQQLGAQGLSFGQLQQGFGDVGQSAPVATKLNQIYGGNVTADDLIKEVFQNDAQATNKIKGLASQERAQFAGSTGVGRGSFSTQGGQI